LPRSDEEDEQALAMNGNEEQVTFGNQSERAMTAWESLLWNSWLPKVRSAIK
jgi:hypothetical protein